MAHLNQQVPNLELTRRSLRKVRPHRKVFAVGALAGAYRWCRKQVGEGSDQCLYCDQPAADRSHIWWQCVATEKVRVRFGGVGRLQLGHGVPRLTYGHSLVEPADFVRRFALHDFEDFREGILDVIRSGRAATDGLVEDLFSDGHGSNPTDGGKCLTSQALVRCSGRQQMVVATGAVTGSRHSVPGLS